MTVYRDSYSELLLSLDRCRHGAHEGEPCGACPDGVSEGNPHLKTGQKLGYSVTGTEIYLPPVKDFDDPTAWTTPPPDVTSFEDTAMNAVYRERNQLVAGLTHLWRSILVAATDYPGMWLVYLYTPAGQLSWHIPEHDLHLFGHVPRAAEPVVPWDGHSNDEKYRRVAHALALAGSVL